VATIRIIFTRSKQVSKKTYEAQLLQLVTVRRDVSSRTKMSLVAV